jgi:hypothetical protein
MHAAEFSWMLTVIAALMVSAPPRVTICSFHMLDPLMCRCSEGEYTFMIICCRSHYLQVIVCESCMWNAQCVRLQEYWCLKKHWCWTFACIVMPRERFKALRKISSNLMLEFCRSKANMSQAWSAVVQSNNSVWQMVNCYTLQRCVMHEGRITLDLYKPITLVWGIQCHSCLNHSRKVNYSKVRECSLWQSVCFMQLLYTRDYVIRMKAVMGSHQQRVLLSFLDFESDPPPAIASTIRPLLLKWHVLYP